MRLTERQPSWWWLSYRRRWHRVSLKVPPWRQSWSTPNLFWTIARRSVDVKTLLANIDVLRLYTKHQTQNGDVHQNSHINIYFMGFSFRLAARVLLYAPSHRQNIKYSGLSYTNRGALTWMRNSSVGPAWRIDSMTHHTMCECSIMEPNLVPMFLLSTISVNREEISHSDNHSKFRNCFVSHWLLFKIYRAI